MGKSIFLSAFCIFNSAFLFAAAPDLINYQGKLADASGNPITGTRDFTVEIYDNAAGPALKFGPETHTSVPVVNGVFSLQIGSVLTEQLSGAFQGGGGRWLQIAVGGSVMAPRQQLASVPYALAVATQAIANAEVKDTAGITVNKLDGGTFKEADYSLAGSSLTVSSMTVTNYLGMGNRRIVDLADPVNDQDAATKKYIATALGGGIEGAGIQTSSLTVAYSVHMATSSGSVGIGTTEPSEKLDVAGTVKASAFSGPGILKQIQSASPTTTTTFTSTTFMNLDGLSLTMTTGNSTLLIFFNFHGAVSNSGGHVVVRAAIDGSPVGGQFVSANNLGAGSNIHSTGATGIAYADVSAGEHTVTIQARITTGSITHNPSSDRDKRSMTVIEFSR